MAPTHMATINMATLKGEAATKRSIDHVGIIARFSTEPLVLGGRIAVRQEPLRHGVGEGGVRSKRLPIANLFVGGHPVFEQ